MIPRIRPIIPVTSQRVIIFFPDLILDPPAIKHINFCDSPSDDFPSYKPPCIAECHQSMRDFCTHNHNIDGHTPIYPTMFDFQGFPLVI